MKKQKKQLLVNQLALLTDNLAVLQASCQIEDGINRLNDFLSHEKLKAEIEIVVHSNIRIADLPSDELQGSK